MPVSTFDFEKRLAQTWPPSAWRPVPVLVAVSGGADSVALLTALRRLSENPKSSLIVGHFNHRWRGEESDAEAQFVRELAARYGLSCEMGSLPATAEKQPPNEAAARHARYQFLQQTAERHGARYLATAHTADDQAETVLHRILRGTGIAGLAGIPRIRVLSPAVTLIRPLLVFRHADIEAYLAKLNQTFCHDSSNRDIAFTRNRIRHELLPELAENYNPEVIPALLRLADLADETQQYLAQQADPLLSACIVRRDADQIVISRKQLGTYPPLLIREFFLAVWAERDWPRQAMGYREWERLQKLTGASDDEKAVLPGDVHCENRGDEMVLARK